MQQQREIEDLKQRVAVLERRERSYYESIDSLLQRVAALEGRTTLTLQEKRKSA